MKIDFSTEMKTIEGKPLPKADSQGKVEGVVKLKDVCVRSLLAVYANEPNLPVEKKVGRFTLAQKVVNEGEIDLTPEEVVMIKHVVGKNYGALIVGQTYALLK